MVLCLQLVSYRSRLTNYVVWIWVIIQHTTTVRNSKKTLWQHRLHSSFSTFVSFYNIQKFSMIKRREKKKEERKNFYVCIFSSMKWNSSKHISNHHFEFSSFSSHTRHKTTQQHKHKKKESFLIFFSCGKCCVFQLAKSEVFWASQLVEF